MKEIQTQKTDKESIAYQAGGDIINNNGPSLAEVSALVKNLFEINNPLIIRQAKDEAKRYVEIFIDDFLSELKDELEISIIQENFKKPSSQFLLKEGMDNAARYGNTCDLKLLAKAIQQAMLENDNEKVLLASSASSLIPQLQRQQLSLLSIIFFVNMLGVPEKSFKFPAIVHLELLARQIVLNPENMVIGKASKFHLITLGICSFNQFAAGSAESFLQRRYPTTFNEQILPIIKQNNENTKTLKTIIDYYNKNELAQLSITPVGGAIAFLIAKAKGSSISEDLFGQF